MIKIDRVDLNIISEEYFQYLYTWLFDKGNFDKWKATFSLPLDYIQLKCYNFLCSKMEVALKDHCFVLASPEKLKSWIVFKKHKGKYIKSFISLMSKLYEEFFQAKIKTDKTIGYWLVEKLNIRVCPYCNRNYIFTVSRSESPKVRATFDHYLPKKKFPMFALCFYNLIPSCPVCNKLKGERLISFNPYQEAFPADQKFILSNGKSDLSWVHPSSELKVSLSNSDDNLNKSQFLLEELYQQHDDIAKDIVMKAQAYNDNYYDGVIQSFQGAGYTKEYINNLIWGVYINDNQLDKRPLSKFTKDILEQIGII